MSYRSSAQDQDKPPPTDRGVTAPKSLPFSSVDYYTATTDDQKRGFVWGDIFDDYKKKRLNLGSRVAAFRRHSYDCMTIDHLTYGYSLKWGWLLTASSSEAEETWRRVWPGARRVTRVDLAYTFGLKGVEDYVYSRWRSVQGRSGRLGYRYIENNQGGQTLYVGSPQSDQTGRLYAKWLQDPGAWPECTYRAEVQYRKPRSDLVAQTLIDCFGRGTYNQDLVINTVSTWFDDRHVRLSMPRDTEAVRFQVSKEVTADDRKLKWLRTGVSPTLVDLAGRGKIQELSEALGLKKDEYVQLSLYATE